MCGIAGIVSNNEDETSSLLKQMLLTMQHRGPDGAGFVIGEVAQRKEKFEDLNFKGEKGYIALGHVRLAITGGMAGIQPFQSKDGQLSLLHNGEIYNYRELRSELEDEYEFETDSDSEVILKLVEKHYKGDLATAVKQILPKLDGVYALAITDNKQVVIARDKIGVRQLYFYIGGNYIAFASEKKALIAISASDEKIQRLLPGHKAILNRKGIQHSCFWNAESIWPTDRIKDKEKALKVYGKALSRAIKKRIAGRKRVGILFSGGIDSFLVAYKVQKQGVPFTCYTAGREGAPDIEWASSVAREFNFPLEIKELTLDEIEKLIPEVIRDIEDYSVNQVEVAVPMYASLRIAQEAGERVILTGQGADELFGGYSWYPKIIDHEGYESFERCSQEDTLLLYKECLEREDKVAMAHSLELRVPYLDLDVIKVAFQIPPELKIRNSSDRLGKRIHREYSVSIGVPKEIAFRRKEAAQHGADVHSALEELASRTGVTKSVLEDAGYNPDQSTMEKLGSSCRYGFRYGDRHLWKPSPQVQYYLDTHAARLNLLPPKSRALWQKTTRKLQANGLLA